MTFQLTASPYGAAQDRRGLPPALLIAVFAIVAAPGDQVLKNALLKASAVVWLTVMTSVLVPSNMRSCGSPWECGACGWFYRTRILHRTLVGFRDAAKERGG